jgi:integrase/recombinase XerD
MLTRAVETYLAVRRAAGFALRCEGFLLKSFAAFSEAKKQHYISTEVAIEWAGLAESQRGRRLGIVIRLARYLRTEDERHEVPPAVFGAERPPRRTPYILTAGQIRQLIEETSRTRPRLARATYSTLFSLLACTGLRVSEATRLRLDDITPDGLVIRNTKFRKSRLVPLHETAQSALERYLQQRCPYLPFDDHVFVSLERKPLSLSSVDGTFRKAVKQLGCRPAPAVSGPPLIPCATPLPSELSKPARMAAMPSPSTCWRYRPIWAIARWPTRIGIWKRCRS